MIDIRKNEILESIIPKHDDREYDVCVMYSGGKDSAFLLYLLKEVYGLRVMAVMVDNGFENADIWESITKFTNNLGIDFRVIDNNEIVFKQLFNALITHWDVFARDKVNHICFICNNILWATVVKYAYDNNIPYVASGLSIDQLESGRSKPLISSKLGNAIAEKSTQKIFINALEKINNLEGYHELKEYINGLSEARKNVKTVYPYIYHDIPVYYLKDKLDELQWLPPNGLSKKEYISSGCIIMQTVIYELEKLGIITLNEREQAKRMIQKGNLDQKEMSFATYSAKGKKVDLTSPLFEELNIKDFLIDLCKEKNNEVAI